MWKRLEEQDMEDPVEKKPTWRRLRGKQRKPEGRPGPHQDQPEEEMVSSNDIALVDLFGGVSSLRVALTAAGFEVCWHQYVETNGAATKLVKHWFPDAQQMGDIKPLAEAADKVAEEIWKSVRALENKPIALVLGCGFPCRELSGVNQNRQGLHHGQTALFYDAKKLFQSLVNSRNDSDPPLRVIFENVQSMPDEDHSEITQELRSVDPDVECVGIDSATVSHCRRPRYWWTNWYVQRFDSEAEATRKGVRHVYPWLELDPVDNVLEGGYKSALHTKSPDLKYHTFTR